MSPVFFLTPSAFGEIPIPVFVTLNGSTAESLAREYSEARQAIERAISAVPYPHGRDYPSATQDAFGIAYEQYKKLIDFLRAAAVEMEAIEEFLSK